MGLNMQKTFFPLAFFLSVFFSPFGFAEEPDFEGLEWGMHAPEVIEVKGSGIIDRGDGYIAYWERIQGKKFKVYYYFDEVGLMHIEYHFEDKVREGESYLDLMYLYRDVLSSKFGDPGDPKIVFSVDIDPDNLEKAVRDGKLRYVFFWEDEKEK